MAAGVEASRPVARLGVSVLLAVQFCPMLPTRFCTCIHAFFKEERDVTTIGRCSMDDALVRSFVRSFLFLFLTFFLYVLPILSSPIASWGTAKPTYTLPQFTVYMGCGNYMGRVKSVEEKGG